MTLVRSLWSAGVCGSAVLLASVVACSHGSRDDGVGAIKVTGSDTMVNLANAWREAFEAGHPDISLQVKGGGSGVGIAALCAGKIDVATASRPMKPAEIDTARQKTGKEPKEFVVGRDALAIYINKQNPLNAISLAELAEIYGEEGKLLAWSDLELDYAACSGGKIIPVGRQNSSGTYAYFKEAVLGEKREYRQGLTSQSGSSDVVSLISKTPCAIGYSGMGYYKADLVKMVPVAKEKGGPAISPSVESALDGTYPISRPLYLYTLGEPSGAVQEFIQWVRSDEGQKTVEEQGYVPLPKEPAAQ